MDPASAQERSLSHGSVSPIAAGAAVRARVHDPRVVTYSASRGDSVLEAHTLDLTEELAVIVQFQTSPSAEVAEKFFNPAAPAQAAVLSSQVEQEHARFRTDLARILTGSALSPSLQKSPLRVQGTAIQREFRHLFNGAALRIPRWVLGEIQKLSYVKSISPDRPLKALDGAADHLIGADSLSARLALSGKGVRLGFLDTGLDYRLPEFGGTFGEGSRTRGGWDFVNNDGDPSDDNGHGTEVASVAAAGGTGTARGEAPEATLYIYKVLDEKGEGVSSVAIAALERALADSAQILNLSFGAVGDPTDPLSQAVDNLTRSGVLCVAAAGNSGPGYQTIGSPGCASGALTIGASDFSDHMSDFSSRGPTDLAFSLKPDLVAPGVALTALDPGGSLATVTGTSFAAPLATGAAALLKELHPDWNPEMLKSALMAGAGDLGGDLWSQGKGRLDALKASEQAVLVLPQSLSLGFADMAISPWVRLDTLTLVNLSTKPRSYHIEAPSTLPAGITLTVLSADPTILPGGESSVIIRSLVDNQLVQIPSTNPPAVTGVIRCTNPMDTLTVPFALLLGSYIDLEITATLQSPIVCFAHTDGTIYRSSDIEDMKYDPFAHKWTVRRLLKPGAYDICAQLGYVGPGLTWLIRDSILVNPAAKVVMNQNEALYTVGTFPMDERGQRLDSMLMVYYGMRMYSRRTGRSFGSILWGNYYGYTQFLNKLPVASANWVYDYCSITDQTQPKVYSSAGEVLGPVSTDHIVELKEGDYTKRTLDYRFHGPVESFTSVNFFAFEDDIYGWGWYSAQHPTALAAPFHQEWYATGEPLGNFPFNQWYFNLQELFSYSGTPPFAPDGANFLMLTPNLHPGADGVLRTSFLWSKEPALETRSTGIIYGLGPRFYFGRTANAAAMLKVKTNTWLGVAWSVGGLAEPHLPLFLNQAMDYTPVSLQHRLFDSQGQLLASGTTPMGYWEELTPDGHYYERSLVAGLPSAGRYSFEITDTASWVLNRRGVARVILTQDTRLADKNPPSMASFEILADSERTDQILPGQVGVLQTVVADQEGPLQDVRLFYRTDADTAWRALPLTNTGNSRYTNRSLAILPEAYIFLRLLATDPSGNSLDYRAEPAFYNGVYQNHAPLPPASLRPGPGDTVQLYSSPQPIAFHWHQVPDPDRDSLRYQMHLWGPALDTTLTALTDTLASFTLPPLVPGQRYSWTVITSDGQVSVSSDTTHFHTSSTVLAVKEPASNLPTTFLLEQNYPNPFNPSTTLRFGLPSDARVKLTVYDILGREVARLADGLHQAGYHAVVWNAQNAASGLYFARLTVTNELGRIVYSKTDKLLLTR